MAKAIPGIDSLAGRIVKHPALARLHAGLVDAVTQHIIIIAHHNPVQSIDNLALVAFDIDNHSRGMEFFRSWGCPSSTVLESVMGNGKDSAAKRVRVCD